MNKAIEHEIVTALGSEMSPPVAVLELSPATLPSWFAVSDLAVASIGAAACEVADLLGARHVDVDRRKALMWFGMTLRPQDWTIPDAWDAIAGDYAAQDGWIRLHTNAPRHRAAVMKVLDCDPDRMSVSEAVACWRKADLEDAVIAAGGAAAAMHSLSEWARHPQGMAVAREPLIAWRQVGRHSAAARMEGLRVLDLTRVLAGPVATRFLAGFGANVLRIDPPDWTEANVEPEVTLGKRLAGLDLRRAEKRVTFEHLLQSADVLVHGYRPGALAGLGYDEETLRRLAPDVIEVSLDAYGWSGPWAGRRGFDSLVQMSSGIAQEGMARSGASRPVPLPVQALDHATGYLMAAAVLRALRVARASGDLLSARLSLARTARLLVSAGVAEPVDDMPPEEASDFPPELEMTGWGPARRLRFPGSVGGRGPRWPHPAGPLRRDAAVW